MKGFARPALPSKGVLVAMACSASNLGSINVSQLISTFLGIKAGETGITSSPLEKPRQITKRKTKITKAKIKIKYLCLFWDCKKVMAIINNCGLLFA